MVKAVRALWLQGCGCGGVASCWCSALGVESFQDLCDLIVLEQFKNSVPDNIATHICEQKVKTAMEAAALAEDYVLTHGRHFGERCVGWLCLLGGE